MALGCTEAEARARTALIDVESYEVFLDLAGDGAVFNGRRLDQDTAVADGRRRLAGLAADNLLTVDTAFPYSRGGRGMSRFADPADGAVYVLGSCFPTHAPSVFCCFDQPDLRADITLTVSAPAGWECVANGEVTARPQARRERGGYQAVGHHLLQGRKRDPPARRADRR